MCALGHSWQRLTSVGVGIVVTALVGVAWELEWLLAFGTVLGMICNPYGLYGDKWCFPLLYISGAIIPILFLPFIGREIVLGLAKDRAEAMMTKRRTIVLALGPAAILIFLLLSIPQMWALWTPGELMVQYALQNGLLLISSFFSLVGLILGLAWRVWRVGDWRAMVLLILNGLLTLTSALFLLIFMFRTTVSRPPG